MKQQAVITLDADGFVETRIKEGRTVVGRMIHATGNATSNFNDAMDWVRKAFGMEVAAEAETENVSDDLTRELSKAHGRGSGKSRL